MSITRLSIVGLGAIGREVVRALQGRESVTIVSAADPAFAGYDLGELTGLPPLSVPVEVRAVDAFNRAPADVALVLTGSGTGDVMPVIEAAAAANVDVISSCEDLAYASHGTPELAARVDACARDGGITVLGTGVNPGFVMDRLPLVLSGGCVRVDKIFIERVVDAAKRRGPLRAKIGAELTVEEFDEGVAARRLGHRGLPESCGLVAAGLGLRLDEIRTSIAPVITSMLDPRPGVTPGRVAGLRQSAVGLHAGREVVHLEMEMSIGVPDPHDRIRVEGDPPLDVLIGGGAHGDRGTVATVINAIPAVVAASPGLKTILDLPLYGIVK